jgi:hypothetical protein
MYFMMIGPMVPLMMVIFEKNFILAKNMVFFPTKELLFLYLAQMFMWILWIVPVALLINEFATTDKTLRELNDGDFDLIALMFTAVQIMIRSLVVAMKYGTLSEQNMRLTTTQQMGKRELFSSLTSTGWLKIAPNTLMSEIGETLVRMDTEPKFFTFHAFNDIGKETYNKLTDSEFTQKLDLDAEGHFDYDHGLKRELKNDEVLGKMFGHVLDGAKNKHVLYEEILKDNKDVEPEIYEDLWHHVKEEVTQKDNYKRYM